LGSKKKHLAKHDKKGGVSTIEAAKGSKKSRHNGTRQWELIGGWGQTGEKRREYGKKKTPLTGGGFQSCHGENLENFMR